MHYSAQMCLMFPLALSLFACSSGGGTPMQSTEGDPQDAPQFSQLDAPDGDITHYGVVTVGDEAGMASDLVGAFFRLDRSVSAPFLQAQYDGSTASCQVQSDDTIDFEELSVGFVPNVPGTGKVSVSAGESILLTSEAGTYAALQEQPTSVFLFYDLDDMQALSSGPVPASLTLDIPGSEEIAAFSSVPVPGVTSLSGTSTGEASEISVSTRFSWEASGDPAAMIRIFTSTAGGFFLEDGVTVTCVVPDNGSFSFPASIQAELGSDFRGTEPLISRVVVDARRQSNTLLYVVRESFE